MIDLGKSQANLTENLVRFNVLDRHVNGMVGIRRGCSALSHRLAALNNGEAMRLSEMCVRSRELRTTVPCDKSGNPHDAENPCTEIEVFRGERMMGTISSDGIFLYHKAESLREYTAWALATDGGIDRVVYEIDPEWEVGCLELAINLAPLEAPEEKLMNYVVHSGHFGETWRNLMQRGRGSRFEGLSTLMGAWIVGVRSLRGVEHPGFRIAY